MRKFLLAAITVCATISAPVAYADNDEILQKEMNAAKNSDAHHKVKINAPIVTDFTHPPALGFGTLGSNDPIGIKSNVLPTNAVHVPKVTQSAQNKALQHHPVVPAGQATPQQQQSASAKPLAKTAVQPVGQVPLPAPPAGLASDCLNGGGASLTASCLTSLGIPANAPAQMAAPVTSGGGSLSAGGAPVLSSPTTGVACAVSISTGVQIQFQAISPKACIEGAIIIGKPSKADFNIMISDIVAGTSGINCKPTKDDKIECSIITQNQK